MADTAADTRGMKRICPNCGTRYYDFNKRPIKCPNCSTEFTGEIKIKSRRSRSVANDAEGQVKAKTAAALTGEEESEEDKLTDDGDTVSLEDVAESDDTAEEDDLEADLGDLDEDLKSDLDDEDDYDVDIDTDDEDK